jgi:hypothetical protein
MGGAASKAKGSAFEREVCKRLSAWLTDGVRPDIFWRSAMSGGRATIARKRGVEVRQAGDITAVAPEGHALTDRVYIECKHYKDLQLDSFVVKGIGMLATFWERTCKEAGARHREPWLIARQNRVPTVLVTPYAPLAIGQLACDSVADIHKPQCTLWLFDDVMNSKPPEGLEYVKENPVCGPRRHFAQLRERLVGG